MSKLLYQVDGPLSRPGKKVSLAEVGLRERADLQEWVLEHPEALGDGLYVVTSEFDQWTTGTGKKSKERLDVLAIDDSGRLVVIELKREGDPEVHLQAITYAALVAGFSEESLAEAHSAFLSKFSNADVTASDALERLRSFAGGALEQAILSVPRIVLLAAHFPPSVVTTVVWLTNQGLDIELREIEAWQINSEVFVTFNRIFPVPGIEELLLSPGRRQAQEAVKLSEDRNRSSAAVTRLLESGSIPDGAEFTISIQRDVNVEVRTAVEAWLAQDPNRRTSRWRNDPKGPLVWDGDGQGWKPSSLIRHIVRTASGFDRSLRGTAWWLDGSGRDLVTLADELT